jgi:HprK-related kinase A
LSAQQVATVGELSPDQLALRLAREGVGIRIGPLDVLFRVRVDGVAPPFGQLYAQHPLLGHDRVFSGHLDLREVWQWRPRPHRKVRFTVDGQQPHENMPADQGLAVLEWGLNLVVALRFQSFLMLHAAVLERHGAAVVMPAQPGQGKTTLCAALAHRGWRLFSDEFGMMRPDGGGFLPLPRPMPLKNASIAVIRQFAPEAWIGPEIAGTLKGTVAHVRPPAGSVAGAQTPAPARWIVFPRWQAGAALTLREVAKGEAFMRTAANAFNYELLGEAAFVAVRDIVTASRCFELVYSDLESAVAAFERLANDDIG